MVNFYRRFLPDIAHTLQPLTNALRGSLGAGVAAGRRSTFSIPTPNAVLSLATDASNTHVRDVLQQLAEGSWQPLAFYSKKLSGAGTW
jgi:hypothetical protein